MSARRKFGERRFPSACLAGGRREVHMFLRPESLASPCSGRRGPMLRRGMRRDGCRGRPIVPARDGSRSRRFAPCTGGAGALRPPVSPGEHGEARWGRGASGRRWGGGKCAASRPAADLGAVLLWVPLRVSRSLPVSGLWGHIPALAAAAEPGSRFTSRRVILYALPCPAKRVGARRRSGRRVETSKKSLRRGPGVLAGKPAPGFGLPLPLT